MSLGLNDLSFNLFQNYPNPFNPSTTIRWQLPVSTNVSLNVHNVLGNEIAVLVDKEIPAGMHQINFNASSLSNGVYFYNLKAGDFSETKMLLILK